MLKKHVSGAVILSLLVLLLAACTSQVSKENQNSEQVNQQASTGHPNGATVNNTEMKDIDVKNTEITKADMEIDSLKIGESLDSIEKQYGKPDEVTIANGTGEPLWIYKSKGFEVTGERLTAIRVYGPFKGSTPRNISIGSSTEEVMKAYPDVKEITMNGELSLDQKSPDRKYEVVFEMKEGKVARISLVWDVEAGAK